MEENFSETKSYGFQNILSIIIAISLILLQYEAFVLSYGMILLLGVSLILFFKNKKILLDKDFIIISLIITVQQIIVAIVFNLFTTSNINTIINIWLINIICSIGFYIDKKNIYKGMRIIGIIVTLIIYIQFFLINFLNMKVNAIMLFPQSSEKLISWAQNYSRPVSFFSEPQVFCSYIFPLLIASFNNKDYKLFAFITIGIILTGSSLGIMILAFIFCYVLFTSKLKHKIKIMIFFMFIVVIILFLTLNIFSAAREKIFTVFTDFSLYSNAEMTNNHSYTNYLRLLKGWMTYFEMPLEEKILGIGMTNFSEYLKRTDIIFSWNRIWSNDAIMAVYFSSAGGIFIECGFIVSIIYNIFLLKKYKNGNLENRSIILLLFIQCFLTQIFFNNIFIYYFLLYYSSSDKKNIKTLKIKF